MAVTAEQVRSMFADRALKAVDVLSVQSRQVTSDPMPRVIAASAAALACAILQCADEARLWREFAAEIVQEMREEGR